MSRSRIAQRRRRREEREFQRLKELAEAGEQNRARVAHHEMGHSALLWFQRAAGEFVSVTIVQHAVTLGLTRSQWPAQKTRAEMKALLSVQIAGRVAEERAFDGSFYHGDDASGDQHNWTRTARAHQIHQQRHGTDCLPEFSADELCQKVTTFSAELGQKLQKLAKKHLHFPAKPTERIIPCPKGGKMRRDF
ncbi:hypothetical protein GPALN_001802 [Globodera pallida]|nr:hypothetical protein GPALN_001802 [Globodera pallida]